jgi:hypothetical protein
MPAEFFFDDAFFDQGGDIDDYGDVRRFAMIHHRLLVRNDDGIERLVVEDIVLTL